MTTGTAAQLVIDTTAFMALRSNNMKSAKFRYVHPAPKAGGTNSPNVVSSSWAGNIEVTWYDYRAGKRGRIVECRFTRVA